MRLLGAGLFLAAAVALAAGCPKQGKAVPAEVEIDWPDAAPHGAAKDGAAGRRRGR